MYSSILLVFVESRIELAEMLVVPCVLHWNTLRRFESCRVGPGDVCDPKETLYGEDSAEYQVAHLQGAGAYVAAAIATQHLPVPRCAQSSLAAGLFVEEQRPPEGRLDETRQTPKTRGDRCLISAGRTASAP